jgi:hypothetical protein
LPEGQASFSGEARVKSSHLSAFALAAAGALALIAAPSFAQSYDGKNTCNDEIILTALMSNAR